MFGRKITIMTISITLLCAAIGVTMAQSGASSDKYFSSETLAKSAAFEDRGIGHLNKGAMKIMNIENFGMIGRLSPYSRHGDWGDMRWILPYVALPPGPWGAAVNTADYGIVDRSDQYNVIESFSFRFGDLGQSAEYTDWEAKDDAATRLRGEARANNGWFYLAKSDAIYTWPQGYFDGSDVWQDTPGEYHWPGPFAVDEFGVEIPNTFVSDRDLFYVMTDKYNGIRAGFEAGVGYPVGLDVHVTGYSFENTLYENIVFLKYDVHFRDDIAAWDPGRDYYSGTIDSVYFGFVVDPDLPGADPDNNQTNPWAIDDFAYLEKEDDALIMYDKRGWAEDLDDPFFSGPVSLYSIAFLNTPESRGITDFHFVNQEGAFTMLPVGAHYEEVLYAGSSGKTELMASQEEYRWFFHQDPSHADYPHFDNLDSLLIWNEYDNTGYPYPTYYSGGAADRPDVWFTFSSGPFSISPGGVYPMHITLIGSEDNPGALDPGYYDFPVNTPVFNALGTDIPTDRFGTFYTEFAKAKSLYDNNFTNIVPETIPTTTWTPSMSAGWHLFGLSNDLTDKSLSSVLPTATSAWEFDGSYSQVSTLEKGKGYWVNLSGTEDTPREADAIQKLDLHLEGGWHMIGTISSDANIWELETLPEYSLVSVYRFNGWYERVWEIMTPGEGYWVNVHQNTTLFLRPADSMSKSAAISKDALADQSRFSKFPMVFEAGNESRTLEVCFYNDLNEEEVADLYAEYELPPLPPAGVFDVRFQYDGSNGSDKMIWRSGESDEAFINIRKRNDDYVTVRWDNAGLEPGSYYLTDGFGGIIFDDIDLAGTNSFELDIPNLSMLKFVCSGKTSVIGDFALFANYPNPFNPTTTIAYRLKEDCKVSLGIYNALGQMVRHLVNTDQASGHYTLEWDGTDNGGQKVASGLYFYRIITDTGFTQTRKMMILK
ncbi:FlgD immunoglobulin-like domain containing protein [candidate division KSB1 bacterium]